MLASYALSPKTSIYNKKVVVDFAFVCPLYKGRVGVNHGVFYIAASCAFAAFFQCCFHLKSAHLAMYIVDLHLCWWPPNLYGLNNALLL